MTAVNTDDNDEFCITPATFPSLTSQLDSQSSYMDSQLSYTICSLNSPQSTNIINNLDEGEDKDPNSQGEGSQISGHLQHRQGLLTQTQGLYTDDTTGPTTKHYRRSGAPSLLSKVRI